MSIEVEADSGKISSFISIDYVARTHLTALPAPIVKDNELIIAKAEAPTYLWASEQQSEVAKSSQ